MGNFMVKPAKIAFIFPGQGAQYPGMGKDFFEAYSIVRETYEEADDLLGRGLSDIILRGPEAQLTKTNNSQTGIYIFSIALLRLLRDHFPAFKPAVTAGLSLGEYTALTAASHVSFQECLSVVERRGKYMYDACEETKGTMAVVLGLTSDQVKDVVKDANMPNELFAANFNCPGQVVISGTIPGVEAGSELAKKRGAKRVLPLQVHGAFHSGLMQSAEDRLRPHVLSVPMHFGVAELFMNVTGNKEKNLEKIRENLILQVTHPVLWEEIIHKMEGEGVDLYVEVGPGKALSGFNKRIGTKAQTISIEHVKDLEQIAALV
jgi:[acyl-carrier-protein] S-malonyltransferase